jgi:hypothetical protein
MSDVVGAEGLARRFVTDVWNWERPESVHALIAPDCPGAFGPGPEGTLAWHRDRRTSFPDLRYEIVEVVAHADRAAVRWRARGTQRGRFGPVPPGVEYSGATFLRFDDSARIVDVWSVNELLGVLEQLGVRFTPPDDAP